MFSSFTNKQDKSTDSTVLTEPRSTSMDTSDDSFAHIDYSNQPALTMKLSPLNDSIGVGADKKTATFCATVTARDLPADDDSKRAPADIVVVLDVSGSMTGTKLELCKTTQKLLLRELRSSDRFGLVSFGSNVNTEIYPKKLTQFNKDFAHSKIESLRTHGCTNMSGGIGMAAQEIRSIESPHDVQAVFLLTDGQANEGISDREGIVKLTKGCLGSGSGSGNNSIPIHCFGYGSDHDSEMLKDISQATAGGTYYFVDNDSDVSTAFGDALGGVLSIVAQNVTVTLKVPQDAAANGVKILEVKHDKATKNDDGSFSIVLNDLYAEESRDIVFEVSLSDETNYAPVIHATSSLSYLDTINKKLDHSENFSASVKRPSGNEVSPSNNHVLLQCTRVKTTKVIAEAKSLADNGKLDTAKTMINTMIDELQKLDGPSSDDPFVVQMLNELNNIVTGLSSRTIYEARGGHYMQSRIVTHAAQRCCEASLSTPSVYKNSAKSFRAMKMSPHRSGKH